MVINQYLKYGTSKKFEYCYPVSIVDIGWEEAKYEFKNKLSESLNNFSFDGIAFCGTISACHLLELSNIKKTWSIDIGIDTTSSSELLNCENNTTKINNLEDCLIKIQKLNKFPRSSLEDIYAFTRQKYWSQFSNIGLCEGGTDYLLAPHYNVMKMNEYNFMKALKIISYDKIKKITFTNAKTYSECFNDSISIFTDYELIDLGLDPISISLREDTLEHYFKALFDWGYETVYNQRTSVFADYFKFKTYSPYINNNDMVNFCLSLPVEMKLCLGRQKHILKESIPVKNEIKKKLTNRIFPNIYSTIKTDIDILINKYLKDKNRIIFKYLPFNKVQKYLDYLKGWNLLNLSIWMEINK